MSHILCFLFALSTAYAQLTFDKAEVEITPKPEQDSLIVEFPFVNHTSREIRIGSLNPSCSCLIVTASTAHIPVGEKGIIRATLDIKNLVGIITKSAEIHIVGFEKPQLISIKATIPELVVPEPRTLQWSFSEPRTSKTVRISVHHDQPLKILSVTSTNSSFTSELRTLEDGKLYEVSVTPPQEQNSAAVLGRLQILSDSTLTRHKTKECFVLLRPKDR